MAILVKLVYPDNLAGVFLRGEYYEGGATYSSKLQTDDPTLYTPSDDTTYNKNQLLFKFVIEDSETRQVIPLQNVVSLEISNDSLFDPASTITFSNLPTSGNYNPDYCYTWQIDFNYFSGDSDNPILSATVNTSPPPNLAGFYQILNWPLSATGGLSTVYIKATVQSTESAALITFANGYDVYDQVFWQSQRPSTPGIPEPLLPQPDSVWCGRDVLWRFRASEEAASGLFGTGVARYVGDIIETRSATVTTTRIGTMRRTIVPGLAETASTTACFAFTSETSGSSSTQINAGTAMPLLSSHGAISAISNSVATSATSPDVGAQGFAYLDFSGNLNANGKLYITLFENTHGSSPWSTNNRAYWAVIESLGVASAQARLYTTLSGALNPDADQTFLLDPRLAAAVNSASGGLLEMYLSTRPDDGFSILTAYFTASGTSDSVVIGSAVVPSVITSNASYLAAAGGFADSACNLYVPEVALVSGRMLLNVDLGDCDTDDANAGEMPSISVGPNTTGVGGLKQAILEGSVVINTEGTTSVDNATTGLSMFAAQDTIDPHNRAIYEYMCATPTYSDRFIVRWSSITQRGEFYITMSPHPTEGSPMIQRCDPRYDAGNQPNLLPTIAVVFSSAMSKIYVAVRLTNGDLKIREWMPWYNVTPTLTSDSPSVQGTSTEWSVQVSNEAPTGLMPGTYISLWQGEDFIGSHRLDGPIPSSDTGAGFYVAAGVRAYAVSEGIDVAIARASSRLDTFSVRGLAAIRRPGALDPLNYRHFKKCNGGVANQKPMLGQMLSFGMTDAGPYNILAPTTASVIGWCNAVTFTPISTTATNQLTQAPLVVDGLTMYAGMQVLVAGQTDPTQNGLYTVTTPGSGSNGVWSLTQTTWNPFDYVQENDIILVDLLYASTATVGADPTTVINMTNTVDGVSLQAGDTVVLDTTAVEGGVYSVITVGTGSNGVWQMVDWLNNDADWAQSYVFRIAEGTTYGGNVYQTTPTTLAGAKAFTQLTNGPWLDGTYWYTPEGGTTFTNAINWYGTTYAQLVTTNGIAPFFSSNLTLDLVELKAQPANLESIVDGDVRIRIHPYNTTDAGPESQSLCLWVGKNPNGNPITTIGGAIAQTDLCQFDLSSFDIPVSNGGTYWMVVSVPPGIQLCEANSKYIGVYSEVTSGDSYGFTITQSLWNKGFLSYRFRHRNVFDGGRLQARILADSHARYPSYASPLASECVADITAPQYTNTGRPQVVFVSMPTVRTATLQVNASDASSGIFAFRIVRETDRGDVVMGPWLPFKDFIAYTDLAPCKYAFDCSNADLLTGSFTIDGVLGSSMLNGDRVLVFSSADEYAYQSYCGIYLMNTSGAWTRATDLPSGADITPSYRALTQQGTLYGGHTWYVQLPAPANTPPYYDVGVTDFNWGGLPQAQIVQYTTYLQGTYPLTTDGITPDTILMSQNQGFDGQRRIWAQVMDSVGNISESKSILAPAQAIGLVDTTPPDGNLAFVSSTTGNPVTLVNTTTNLAKLNGVDMVSSVKDFRWRQIGSGIQGAWSNWKPYSEYSSFNVAALMPNDGVGIVDGVRRAEVQFRDYGNNIIRKRPCWDQLLAPSDEFVLVCSAVWQSPADSAPGVYSGGVESESFTDYTLIDSGNSFYGSNKAFYPISSVSGSVGRTISVRTSDYVVVRKNSVPLVRIIPAAGANPFANAAPNTYFVDSERGLIVFNVQPVATDVLNADIVRRSAVIYRFNGQRRDNIANLGFLGDRIVMSLEATTAGLFIGTDQGNVYCYNGYSVQGPFLTTTSSNGAPLPVTCFNVMQFPYETDGLRIYAGTSGIQTLYRSLLSAANTSAGWAAVGTGFADLTTMSGNITSMCSAFERLFIGTSNGIIYRYRRYVNSNGAQEEELESVTLQSADIADEPTQMPISALLATGSQVFAGIANKPEVWSYTTQLLDNPTNQENWSSQAFDRWFMNDPAPWQYYTSNTVNGTAGIVDGYTFSRSDSINPAISSLVPNIQWFAVSDPDSETGFKEMITLAGQPHGATVIVGGTGSDWEQSISNATVYTLEIETQCVAGTGSQGFAISDGRYTYTVTYTNTTVSICNGNTTTTVSLPSPEVGPFSALTWMRRDYGGAEYVKRGIRRLWNFAAPGNNPYVNEDRGPLWPGGDPATTTSTSVQGWAADQYVVPGTNGTDAGVVINPANSDATENTTSFTEPTRILRVTPTLNGDPRIVLSGISPNLFVDTKTKLYMRVRFVATPEISLSQAQLGVAWATSVASDQGPENIVSTPVKGQDEFHLYEFSPSWRGQLDTLWVEVSGINTVQGGLPPNAPTTPSLFIDIDYVCLAADETSTNFTDNLMPIRVGVNNQDVSIWVGFGVEPLINIPAFLSLPTDISEIRIGKLDTDSSQSQWGYSGVKWFIGEVVPPVSINHYEFGLQWRFPSTGGVTQLLHYQGAATAITQGIPDMRIYDDPNDRAAKAWAYNAGLQVWQPMAPPIPRLDNGVGIVKVLTVAEYMSTLFTYGQSATITYPT